MTFDEIVATVRSVAGDRDTAAQRYTDDEIADQITEERRSLSVRQIAGISGVAYDAQAQTFTPEPSDIQGLILAYAVALALLKQMYRKRIDEGSLGVSWRSGLEEETTISQQRAYERMLDDLEMDLDRLLLFSSDPTSNKRMQ